ncbi:hypothetical protein AUP68_17855 [Ilyonectria robusta]
MDPGPLITETVLFPVAAYSSNYEAVGVASQAIAWGDSTLNPVNRVDSLDISAKSRWDIDGAEADGKLYWVTPKFARGRPPRRIDLYVRSAETSPPNLTGLLGFHKIPLVSSATRGRFGVGRHIIKALDHWSSRIADFERAYMSAPFGSQITVDQIKRDVQSMRITLIPNYDLEKQWLSTQDLQRVWGLSRKSMPESIDIDQLQFKRRLHYSVCIVEVMGQPALGDVIFKSHVVDSNDMYRELQNLLQLPAHPNLQRKPVYLVTKRVRFGGKHGVCGYIAAFYPTGSLDQVMRRPGCNLSQLTRLRCAKDVVRGLIAIRDSPLKYFADLKLDNLAVESNTASDSGELKDARRLVIIDFEQGTPWMEWAPPEVYWVNQIERLVTGNVEQRVQSEHLELLSLLVPDWTPKDRRLGCNLASHSPAWSHLSDNEKSSAVVYMAGKVIWCLMEGAAEMAEPVTLASFLADRSTPVFPNFRNTPTGLRECIRQCTSGAPEWESRQQPFHVRGGKVILRSTTELEGPHAASQVMTAAQEWWKEELESAKRFVQLRVHGAKTLEDRGFLEFMGMRPTMEEVLQAIEDAELSSQNSAGME